MFIFLLDEKVYYSWDALKYRPVIISHEEAKTHQRSFQCPKCSKLMDKGYKASDQMGILWCDEAAELFKRIGTNFKRLENTQNMNLIKKRTNLAWKCDQCKLVLIDHNCLITKKSG